ncbi:hypothetical protein VNO77_15345 [Canavalia gladiata]|uniref:Uncharacterized protein n=1 Tax=Canavalia gladiata TaxID=3824 RepID=A0AAN9QSB6_CANGL
MIHSLRLPYFFFKSEAIRRNYYSTQILLNPFQLREQASWFLRFPLLRCFSLIETHFNGCHFSQPKLKKRNQKYACNEERLQSASLEAMVNTRGS